MQLIKQNKYIFSNKLKTINTVMYVLTGSIISGWISGEADDSIGSEEKLEYENNEEVTVSSEEIIEYSNNQKIDIEKIEIPEQVKINIGMMM